MMTWTLRLTLVAAAVSVITATCPSSEWKQFRDKCYWKSDDYRQWGDAPFFCKMAHPNATMVSIHDAQENAFVAGEVAGYSDPTYNQAWIGLSRYNNTAPWTWADGSPYDFSLWYMDDPDYRGGNCALINYYVEGMWAGLGCSDFYYQFMCQVAAT